MIVDVAPYVGRTSRKGARQPLASGWWSMTTAICGSAASQNAGWMSTIASASEARSPSGVIWSPRSRAFPLARFSGRVTRPTTGASRRPREPEQDRSAMTRASHPDRVVLQEDAPAILRRGRAALLHANAKKRAVHLGAGLPHRAPRITVITFGGAEDAAAPWWTTRTGNLGCHLEVVPGSGPHLGLAGSFRGHHITRALARDERAGRGPGSSSARPRPCVLAAKRCASFRAHEKNQESECPRFLERQQKMVDTRRHAHGRPQSTPRRG